MKRKLIAVFAATLVCAVFAYPQQNQSKGDTASEASKDEAQRIATGQITKIDAKKMVLTVREANVDDSAPASRTPNGRTGGYPGGGYPGGSYPGGGRRGGRGGTGGSYPGGGGPTASKPQGKEFKVTVTDKTSLKDSQSSISFGMLRVGDRITIQGLPKGSGADLDATQITVHQ